MEEVSTWADENKNPASSAWHFLILPLGLSHEQFVNAVQQSDHNVYTAILKNEATLKDGNATPEQKNKALKYLIHLVGDAHQPMHVAGKEDKGGNTIQLRFGKGINLHSLWDSKLIEHEGLSPEQIVRVYDTATPEEISKWQADSPMEWLWESYQLSTELYANAKPGQTMDEAYYKKYIPFIRQRIDQAGIGLAGELNKIFFSEQVKTVSVMLVPPPPLPSLKGTIKLSEVNKAIGDSVTVAGKVFGSKDIGSMVLINLGAAYPKQLLTVVFKGNAKPLAVGLDGKTIAVSGKVSSFKGKPQILVTEAEQLVIQE
ncbi:hypothetical protein GCM10023149_21850 [Mucilaginibacter gynuensis]|uniref:S1/P1 nuclease n=1 Tax=Mucilaginibacter gynuensis TaxID=1302236 RepID=A0ABP8GD80_9SPHI